MTPISMVSGEPDSELCIEHSSALYSASQFESTLEMSAETAVGQVQVQNSLLYSVGTDWSVRDSVCADGHRGTSRAPSIF